MIRVPAGSFVMGSSTGYPEERPPVPVAVQAFSLAEAPVTVAQYAMFVEETGYDATVGSAVFAPPPGPVDLADPTQWWAWDSSASWAQGEPDHPVVHVTLADALAYCAWAGVRLPTEAEWEYACVGAVPGNTWQGSFPFECLGVGGTSPVGAYPPSSLGLVDLLGNVWEWTATPWTASHAPACCAAPAPREALQVAKGGSFLCAPSYCARYRPSARMAMAAASSSAHLGFRVAAS